jgi:hypothetical protein
VISVKEREHKVQGVPFFTVEARIYVPAQKYSKGLFRVQILEPIALLNEHLMDQGKFSFDTVKQLKEKQRFKISVSPAA